MSTVSLDCRYPGCSDQAKGELAVYLDWLGQSKLADSEYSFVLFALGRAGLKDVRHLFLIWSRQISGGVSREHKSQMRRFFMNPSSDVSFNVASCAGWFNFLPVLYEHAGNLKIPALVPPKYTKVGFSDLPSRL